MLTRFMSMRLAQDSGSRHYTNPDTRHLLALMTILRYGLYFVGVAAITWLLVRLEIAAPGTLKFQVFVSPGDTLGTSEYSPIELLQQGIIGICALFYTWIANDSPSQRPLAIALGGTALAFFVRELDYFLDRLVADNFWQVIIAIVTALLVVYVYRQRRRFRIAWFRLWPSPALTLIFAGVTIVVCFAPFIGHEPLWMAIMGDNYQRIVKLAAEEFVELAGYLLCLAGTIEYWFQARAISHREPEHVAAKRRQQRRPKSGGKF